MARIEISLEEFDAMKQKIHNLEESSIAYSKELELCKFKYNEILEEINSLPVFSRIFGWKKVLEKINNF